VVVVHGVVVVAQLGRREVLVRDGGVAHRGDVERQHLRGGEQREAERGAGRDPATGIDVEGGAGEGEHAREVRRRGGGDGRGLEV
jgi:hypothetical protein